MADPRTKEELLKEIENAASENESYQEFKTSLAELNQDIDKLMKPGKEGWKLLDKKTFDPLYTKYLRAAKNLSNFLDETKESTKKETKNTAASAAKTITAITSAVIVKCVSKRNIIARSTIKYISFFFSHFIKILKLNIF